MVTEKDLLELITKNDNVLKALLLHLELSGLITIKDRLSPSLSNSFLKDREDEEQQILQVEDWIDDWRSQFNELLDPYSLSMGIGNRQTCIERMKLFMNRFDDVDIIMEATLLYLQDCIARNRKSRKPEFFILPPDTGKISNRDIRTGDLYEWYSKVLEGEISKDISTFNI